jgi:hypothetical protein
MAEHLNNKGGKEIGDQRKKEYQEAKKGQEEGKVKERHRPTCEY